MAVEERVERLRLKEVGLGEEAEEGEDFEVVAVRGEGTLGAEGVEGCWPSRDFLPTMNCIPTPQTPPSMPFSSSRYTE